VRAAGTLISAVITALARDTDSWHEVLRLLDSAPVPCGASRETVKRSDLAGHAGYGYCASHSRYLYLVGTPERMPVIWGLANPKLGEREVTEALLRRDRLLVRDRQVILADKGFAGREFERFVAEDLGANLVRPDRKDEKPRSGRFGGIQQWIESVFDTLQGQCGLGHHGARTPEGLYARVAPWLLALSAGIWHNWKTNEPRKRSRTAYDH
jgi:hypothetical protein